MKTILCYGDSLTWGFIPGTMGKRYGPEVRWPKLVQGLMGSDYEIIEEALNGRPPSGKTPSAKAATEPGFCSRCWSHTDPWIWSSSCWDRMISCTTEMSWRWM